MIEISTQLNTSIKKNGQQLLIRFATIKIWNCNFARLMNNTSFNSFIEQLKKSFQQPLPGEEAQFRLVPPSRRDYPEMDSSNVRLGAVMALFYPEDDGVRLVFIRRSNSEGVHGFSRRCFRGVRQHNGSYSFA